MSYWGLYYHAVGNLSEHELQVDFNFVQTAIENMKDLLQAQLERIKLAQYYQELFSWPSKEDSFEIIE